MRREAPEGVVFDPWARGSEVHPCLEARELLAAKRIAARVVSLPCFEIFDDQPEEYRESAIRIKVHSPGSLSEKFRNSEFAALTFQGHS